MKSFRQGQIIDLVVPDFSVLRPHMEALATLRQLLAESTVFHGEQQQEFEERLLAITRDPGSAIPLLMLMRPEEPVSIQSAAATFLMKSLTAGFARLPDEQREQIRAMARELIMSEMPPQVFHTFVPCIAFLYEETEGHWADLLTVANQLLEGGRVWQAAKVFAAICPVMEAQTFEDSVQYFLGVCLKCYETKEQETVLLAVQLYVTISVRVQEVPAMETHLPAIVELAGNSAEFFGDKCGEFWTLLRAMLEICADEIPPPVCEQFVVIAMKIAANEQLSVQNRTAVIDAVLPIIQLSNKDMILQIWTLCLGIRAAALQEMETVAETEMEHFEVVASFVSHSEVYPLIQERVMAAIQSANVYLQAAGLLVFEVLFKKYKDCVYNDAAQVGEVTKKALESGSVVLILSALRVVKGFCAWQLMNTQSVTFLPILLKLLAHESEEVRDETYRACDALLQNIDTEVPKLFDAVEGIYGSIPPTERYKFIPILGEIIGITDDFEDEQMDKTLELFASIMNAENTENLDDKAAAFDLAIAILHKDEAQLEFVGGLVFPVLKLLLSKDEVDYAQECLDFVGNLASLFRGQAATLLGDVLEPIIAMTSARFVEKVRGCAVRNISCLCKYSEEPLKQQIASQLYPAIQDGFASESKSFSICSAVAVKNVARFIDPEAAKGFFEELSKLVKDDPDDTIFENALLAMARVLKHAPAVARDVLLEKSMMLLKDIMTGQVAILEEKPLLESPIRGDVFPPVATFMSSFFMHKTPFADELCKYLLQWMNDDNELNMSNVVGTLSDAIVHNTISAELHPVVVGAVVSRMTESRDPSFCQNVVFLFNALLQINTSVLSTVMETVPMIEKWRNVAFSSKFGYQDVLANIGSLYLTIASLSDALPKDAIVAGLEQFPPFDTKETASMARSILAIAGKDKVPEVAVAIGMAISRFIVMGESKQAKAEIPAELVQQLFAVFRQLVAQVPAITTEIQTKFARQRSKQRKIMAVLNV